VGVLGRTTLGNVRTARTIEDHSPSDWTSGTSQVEIIHLQTDSFSNHETSLVPSRTFPVGASLHIWDSCPQDSTSAGNVAGGGASEPA